MPRCEFPLQKYINNPSFICKYRKQKIKISHSLPRQVIRMGYYKQNKQQGYLSQTAIVHDYLSK